MRDIDWAGNLNISYDIRAQGLRDFGYGCKELSTELLRTDRRESEQQNRSDVRVAGLATMLGQYVSSALM